MHFQPKFTYVFANLCPRFDDGLVHFLFDQVADAARMLFAASNPPVGCFEPLPVAGS